MRIARPWISAFLATIVFVPFCSLSQAGTIVAWDTFGLAGTEASVAATSTATNISGLDLTRGAGLTPSAAANNFSSSGWNDLAADDYVQLGFNVTAGSPWLVESIRMGTRSSATGPGFVNVTASIDGGAFFTIETLTQPNAQYINPIVAINQVVNSSLVIRFVAANNTAANGGTIGSAGTWRIGDYRNPSGQFEDIIIAGAAVPEPASVLMGGMALVTVAGIVALRRRGTA